VARTSARARVPFPKVGDRVTLRLRCDRCKVEHENPADPNHAHEMPNGWECLDGEHLCKPCYAAYRLFMAGEAVPLLERQAA
jgi:hypothetical protein